MRYAYGDMLQVFTAPCSCGRTGVKFKIIGRTDDMLIVKGVNVYPESIKREILKFHPEVTGYFTVVLDKPGPLVKPPLKIKVEYNSYSGEKAISSLGERMLRNFKENLRISPKFIWIPPNSIPRETKKAKFIDIEEKE